MIAELGHFSLIVAMVIACVQATLPLFGAHNNNISLQAISSPAALIQFLLVALSFACLTFSFINSDFSVLAVAQNSHSLKPLLYKITGVWGNHEGSLLLWILILTGFGAAVAIFGTNLPPALKARVLSVQAMIGIGFFGFILFTSNPFERILPAPIEGAGLNPLLQDPGLAIHPPFLYLGYVGFSMAFSFAVAALIEGKVDPAWARWVRPWTLAAWCFLTTGITLGSWWAYYELGWGGFWFWDPVENASFMPWLAGTALLHSSIVAERRDTLKSWTILLAILTFSLSLLGTFIVRSGVLTSVHAFATDPERGLYILLFLIFVIGGSLFLYALRSPKLKAGGLFAPISRESALVFNNLILTTSCATILLGTLYPMFLDGITGEKISVGPPFFNGTFGPLMIPLFITMVIGPLLPWKRADLIGVIQRLSLILAIALLISMITWIRMGGSLMAGAGLGLASWLIIGSFVPIFEKLKLFRISTKDSFLRFLHIPRSVWGMTFAHLGVGFVLLGITVLLSWQIERTEIMKPGDSINLGKYSLIFNGVTNLAGPNYTAERATFSVIKGEKEITRLFPEQRTYIGSPMITTEAGIKATISGDVYAVIGDSNGSGEWAVRAYFKPFVHWIWIGAFFMVVGGTISLSDRRHRVGSPSRRIRKEKKYTKSSSSLQKV